MDNKLKAAFDLIEKRTVRVRDAANILDLSHGQVIGLIHSRHLEARQINDGWRIVSTSLDAFARSRTERVK